MSDDPASSYHLCTRKNGKTKILATVSRYKVFIPLPTPPLKPPLSLTPVFFVFLKSPNELPSSGPPQWAGVPRQVRAPYKTSGPA